MKKRRRMRRLSYILILTLLTSTLYAQTTIKKVQSINQQEINAKSLIPGFRPQRISWWDSGNGIICKYTADNNSYITRYDKQGKYVETLKQKVWNDNSALQPFFQKSQYRLQKVISYWEVSDANKTGYYLEMSDSKKQTSSVWVDESGNFSTIPTVSKPNYAQQAKPIVAAN